MHLSVTDEDAQLKEGKGFPADGCSGATERGERAAAEDCTSKRKIGPDDNLAENFCEPRSPETGEKMDDRKQEAQAAMTAAYEKPEQQSGDSGLYFLARNGAGRPSRWI